MPVNSVTSSPANSGIQRSQNQSDSQQFLRLLTTQLSNQNPLEPLSDSDFTNQISQLNQVEATSRQTSLLEDIAIGMQTNNILQGLGQASVLIDKSVTYSRDGIESEGIVTGVKFEGGGIQLDVEGQTISLGDLISISSGLSVAPVAPVAADDSTDEAADDEVAETSDDSVEETTDTTEATAEG